MPDPSNAYKALTNIVKGCDVEVYLKDQKDPPTNKPYPFITLDSLSTSVLNNGFGKVDLGILKGRSVGKTLTMLMLEPDYTKITFSDQFKNDVLALVGSNPLFEQANANVLSKLQDLNFKAIDNNERKRNQAYQYVNEIKSLLSTLETMEGPDGSIVYRSPIKKAFVLRKINEFLNFLVKS